MKRFLSFLTLSLFAVLSASAQNLSGLPNFHQVNPQLFRGAQPTPEGLQQLNKLGIRTVIDLREAGERSAAEKKIVEGLGMHYVSVPMKGMHTPESWQIAKVMGIIYDNSAGPVFVHCRRGADRTGTVIAVYRISHDGWNNGRALAEARSLGMSRFQTAMEHYVRDYRPDRNASVSLPTGSPSVASPSPVLPAAAPAN
jgi:tyrosine-protein phosphatase SIW14